MDEHFSDLLEIFFRPAGNRDRLLQIEIHPRTISLFQAGPSRFQAGRKNDKSGAESDI